MMASYNEIDGVPSHANRWLLRDVLRKEWGFKGFVVSDYYAIWELSDRPDTHGHLVAQRQARRRACWPCRPASTSSCRSPTATSHLVELVREGALAGVASSTSSSRRCCYWKFQLGLFDDPYVDPDEAERVVGCDAHRELALQAARETITLLKNDGDLLPLDPRALETIAVIGPNADRSLLGGYSGVPQARRHGARGHPRRASASARRCVYSEGCKITHRRLVERGSRSRRAIRTKTAGRSPRRCKVARSADVIVLAIGGNEQTSREAWTLQAHGRSHEPRSGRAAERTGRRDGRDRQAGGRAAVQRPAARRSRTSAETVPAIFECWYLGQESGTRGRRSAVRRRTIRAASCRSPSRARPDTCRRSTTTSRRRAAAICSTTCRRSTRSASA